MSPRFVRIGFSAVVLAATCLGCTHAAPLGPSSPIRAALRPSNLDSRRRKNHHPWHAARVIGDGDIVTPEHAVEMFRTFPGAHLCVMPHAGHGVMPKETILAFLNEAPTE